MLARFDLSALSRYRSAKFVLALLMAVVAITLATFAARALRPNLGFTAERGGAADRLAHTTASPYLQGSPSARGRLHSKLSLRPEADRLRRRLGRRFLAPGREMSVLQGAVTLGAQRYPVHIVRSQESDGERLTIALGGGQPSLTWSSADGAKSDGSPATGAFRALIERLALDSPDQFVLAQVRAASYYTVARMVRPAEAGGSNSYRGPVWDVVRVGEPDSATSNKPLSSWRLYYINPVTGLVDKVISQEQGQAITAEISGWVNREGEQTPTRITWTLNKQVVMELQLNDVAHGPKQ